MSFEKVLADILESINNNTLRLTVTPEIVISINKFLDDENSSLDDMVKVINASPSVAARLLQVANSSALSGGSSKHVSNTKQAISKLGLTLVRSLVFCISLKDRMATKDVQLRYALGELWEHSIVVSNYCHALSELESLDPNLAMMAGLLHDIGKMPILHYYSVQENRESIPPLLDALHIMGPKIGYEIMTKWQFDQHVADAAFYMGLDKDDIHGYAGLVNLVHGFLKSGISVLTDHYAVFGVPEQKVEELVERAEHVKPLF